LTLPNGVRPQGALRNLFGAYLHQDFDLEYGTVWTAVEDFTSTNPVEWVAAARKELVEILEMKLDERSLEGLVERSGCAYYAPADGYTYSAWLVELEERLRTPAAPGPKS
jgi:CdiI immunity protein